MSDRKKQIIRAVLIISSLVVGACAVVMICVVLPRTRATRARDTCVVNLIRIECAKDQHALDYGGGPCLGFKSVADLREYMGESITNCFCPLAEGTNRTLGNSYSINSVFDLSFCKMCPEEHAITYIFTTNAYGDRERHLKVESHIEKMLAELYGPIEPRQAQPEVKTIVRSAEPAETAPTIPESTRLPRPEEGKPISVDLGGGVEMEFVWIAPGSFTMGSPASEEERDSDEGPQHRVTLSEGYWLGKYEVTQRQYQLVMGKNPSYFTASGLDAPVESVSWNDAKEFCRNASRKTGMNIGLPSEAEWEYACRAGTTTAFYYGESLDSSMANFNGNYPYGKGKKGVCRQKTVKVGSFKPNAWGLYDMHGNVWEWCEDRYDKDYYGKSPESDPLGPYGASRVMRGGSWIFGAHGTRCAGRLDYYPDDSLNDGGFRCVRGL